MYDFPTELHDGMLRAVLTSSQDCIKVISADGIVRFVNDNGLCALEAPSPTDVIGRLWIDLWPDAGRATVLAACESALNGTPRSFRAACPTFTGRNAWWDVTLTALHGADGAVSHLLALSRDVSDEMPDAPAVSDPGETGTAAARTDPETYEAARMAALRATKLLDTPEDIRFDRLTALAAEALRMDSALVSLVDSNRQWFKARHNFEARETARDISFCSLAIQNPNHPLIVTDARTDPRFRDNPLVTGEPHIASYAGISLMSEDGYPIGTLCVVGYTPRDFTKRDIAMLESIAMQVETRIRLQQTAAQEKSLAIANRELIHRLGNTYAQVSSLISLLSRSKESKADFVTRLREKIDTLAQLQMDLAAKDWKAVSADVLFRRAVGLDKMGQRDRFVLDIENMQVPADEVLPLTLALQELRSNSAKYGVLRHGKGRIEVFFTRIGRDVRLSWQERDVPIQSPPAQQGTGFGSQLLKSIVPISLGGTATIAPAPDYLYELRFKSDPI